MLWILVGVEHGIIIIKQLCSSLIYDVPGWVEKSQQRVAREERYLAALESDRERLQIVNFIKEKMEEQGVKRRQQFKELEDVIKVLESQKSERENNIKRLTNEVTEERKKNQEAKSKLDESEKKFKKAVET